MELQPTSAPQVQSENCWKETEYLKLIKISQRELSSKKKETMICGNCHCYLFKSYEIASVAADMGGKSGVFLSYTFCSPI